MEFTKAGLTRDGFQGFVRFAELDPANPPMVGGIYAVLRESHGPPTFLEVSPAGRFKERDPTVTVQVLRQKWVEASPTVYIGKATNLRKRLRQYRDFGLGRPVGHWGGRFIWQLADADQLIVAWKPTESPGQDEAMLIRRFREEHGALPFANLNAGRKAVIHESARGQRSGAQPRATRSAPGSGGRTFVIAGRSVTLTAADLRVALRGTRPERVQVWGVEVDGVLFPVVQALEAATGIPRGETRSARARAVLSALGFRLVRV